MLLLWLLMLVLPVQGVSAATRSGCQPSLAPAAAAVDETAHMHHIMQQSRKDESHHHDARQHASHSHDSSHASPSGKHEHASCSTGAACCVSVAVMPANPDWHPPHAGTELPPAFLVVSFSGHIPAGIERPPRKLLA